MEAPRISVVIPTRNRSKYLLQALESVFAQTYTSYEVIVVDDGSTDDTKDKLGDLISTRRVKYYFQPARGVSAARNAGVAGSKGELIAFLDSDDLFLPSKLEKQAALFLRDPNLGFVHCNFEKFDDSGRELGIRDVSKFSGWVYPQILLEWSALMAMPCMLIPRTVFERVGGFDESLTWAEDLDLWRRIVRHYPIGCVEESLVRVRVHAGSTTFEKRGGVMGFERYLEKAFAEDRDLPRSLKNKAIAKMYAKLGQNLLGEGSNPDMALVRTYSIKALMAQPWTLGAIVGWVASWLPGGIRRWLAEGIRRTRYRKPGQL